MDVSKLTDEELQEAIFELSAQRDELIIQLGALSMELIARQPPAQVGVQIPPLSLYGGW